MLFIHLFIIDVVKEHIAVAEAIKLGIPTIAICDTNSDPTMIDFPIPANDDATKSIELIMNIMVKAVEEGMAERKTDKEQEREKEVAAEEETGDQDAVAVAQGEEEGGDGDAKPKTGTGAGTRTRKKKTT